MEQYNELAQLWHEYTLFASPGPEGWSLIGFVQWLDNEPENPYGLEDVRQFLAERERREGMALQEE